MLPIVL